LSLTCCICWQRKERYRKGIFLKNSIEIIKIQNIVINGSQVELNSQKIIDRTGILIINLDKEL
jgi:hypothetical protein